MVFGLVLSIGLMGVAATYIAKLLHRFRWIGYVGLVIVLYVALHMIWDGYRASVVRTLNWPSTTPRSQPSCRSSRPRWPNTARPKPTRPARSVPDPARAPRPPTCRRR